MGIDLVLARLVLGGELLGLLDGLVNVFLGQVGRSGDGNVLLLARAQILGGDIYDTVGVDVKGNLDLRYAAGCRSDAVELEAAEGLVISSHFPFALQYMHLNRGLAVGSGGEDLALLGGDGGISLDELGEHAAHGLNTQRQRGDIQQQQSLDVAAQHAALNGSAHCNALVGVNALKAFLAGDALYGFLYGGNSGGTAHQQHLADVAGLQTGVGHGLTHGSHGGFHQMGSQLIELCTGQGDVQVLGAVGVCGDIGQIDGGAGHAGQLDLGLFRSLLQTLHGGLVAGQVDALGLLEFCNQIIHDALIKIVAAQMGVAGGGQNLYHAVADVQNGHIEGAAAQVIDHDFLLGFLVHAIGQRRRGRLVDDPLDIQTGDLAGILGCLTLRVVEISGNGDDRLGDGAAQIGLCVRFQLLQNHGGDLLGGVLLVVNGDFIALAHVTLDGSHGALAVGDSLTLCHLTDHPFAGLGKCHDRRGRAVALCVGDDHRLAALHHCHAGIGCAKVDTDNLTHNVFLLL